jgi:hypothetical protein
MDEEACDSQRWSLLQPPDKMFELDPRCLELLKPMNSEGGLGEVCMYECVPINIKPACKKKHFAFRACRLVTARLSHACQKIFIPPPLRLLGKKNKTTKQKEQSISSPWL